MLAMKIGIAVLLLLNSLGLTAAWYKGCYVDKPDDRVFLFSAGNYDPNDSSPQECTYKCAILNFTYAATQGDICFCANGNYAKYGPANNEALCSSDCTDVEKCGEDSYVKVYETADSIDGLKITVPSEDGMALHPVTFRTTLAKGASDNVTYLYNFGDGAYSLTTCTNMSHVYTRVGAVTIEVSARNNISGPVVARVQFYLQSTVGLVDLTCPDDVIATEADTDYFVNVSQGTLMNVTWYWPFQVTTKFGLSDTSIHSIGSKASFGNMTSSPSSGGAYVMPTANVKEDGYLVAWELYASKIGIVRLQVYRPMCSNGQQYCAQNASCIPEASTCSKGKMFSCVNNLCVTNNKSALYGVTSPQVDYQVVAEAIVDITKTGRQLFTLKTEKAIKVKADDIIGWAINSSAGDLAFEFVANEPEFFYPASTFNNSIGGKFPRAGGATHYNIKHVLRAHVSQAVEGKITHKIEKAGEFNVTANVENKKDNSMRTCLVHVQEPIENLKIVVPVSHGQKVCYAANESLAFNASITKGSKVTYYWSSVGQSAVTNCQGGLVNFTYLATGLHDVVLHANNSVSTANTSTKLCVLWRIGELKWGRSPVPVDINIPSNFSFVLVNGMNVTITVCFGDGSPCNVSFIETADNAVFNMSHAYSSNGDKTIKITAKNGIKDGEKSLETVQKVAGQLGEIQIEVRPHKTITGELKVSTGQEFEVFVSTESNFPANYTIDFGDHIPKEPAEGKSVRFYHRYSVAKVYTVRVNATAGTNFVNGSLKVFAEKCGPPAVTMPASENTRAKPLTLLKSNTYELRTKLKLQNNEGCKSGSTTFKWDLVGVTIEGKYINQDLAGSNFIFGPGTSVGMLEAGSYKLNLTITYRETARQEKYYFATHIAIKRSPLEVKIVGGSPRDVPFGKGHIILDAAEGSKDPDDPENKRGLTFKWSCIRVSSPVPGDTLDLTKMCLDNTTFESLNDTSGKISYNSTHFQENITYIFRVEVSKTDRNSSVYDQKIFIAAGEAPAPKILCKTNCKVRVNPQERLILEGSCTNCDLYDTDTTYEWQLLDQPTRSEAAESGKDSYTTTGWNNQNLVFKPDALKPNTKYIARLTIKRGIKAANAEYEIKMTSPPYDGTCSAMPEAGYAMETNYQITCKDWKTNDYPLHYEFRYQTEANDLAKLNTLPDEQEVTTLWYYGLEHTTPFSFLPLGYEATNYTLPIYIQVKNKYGSYANYGPLNVTVGNRKMDKEELKKIENNLAELDPKKDKVAVVQWAAAASSLLNSVNATRDDHENKKQRTEIRSKVISKLTQVEEKTVEGITRQGSVMADAIKEPNEVTSESQEKVANTLERSTKVLKNFANKKDVGAKETEESAQVLLTVAANTVKASASTTKDFLELSLENAIPKHQQPSKAWGVRIRDWTSKNEAKFAEKVVDKIELCINVVSDAIQNFKVLGENATVANTASFDMSLQRLTANKIGNSTQDVPPRPGQEGTTVGSFRLPSSEVLFANISEGVKQTPIDLQVISFPTNPVTWDAKNSPYMKNNIIGLSMRASGNEDESLPIKNLKEKVDIYMPMQKAQPQTKNITFEPGKSQHYMYQLFQEESRAYPLWLEVKPQSDMNLTMYLRFGEKPLKDKYDLKLNLPIGNTSLPPHFRRIDDNIIEINAPKDFSGSGKMHFNLSATDLEDGETLKAPGGGSAAFVSTTVTTNVTVSLTSLSCKYWDAKARSKWEDAGCELGSETTTTTCHCRCNHFTLFGSVVVKPNPIGPLTLEDFKKGYALFVTVCIVFLIYFLVLIWARRKDRADTVKVGVCPLPDNDPADQYRYEITVWTGIRRGAGTSSKVSLILYGEDSDSEPRVLEDSSRKPFARGSVDTFLLTTPQYLGPLIYTRIWHDNSGGSWKLSRIMVIDLQTDERYYFICDRWLAVDEDDGQVEKVVPVASKQELTEFQHLFFARTKRNLSDNHLWFSVVVRPPSSRFTRVQRVSCCLCLFLTALMASAMYYDTLEEPSGQNGNFFGPFSFTWQQVFVGVVSSLIVIPVNLIVVQIFRSVRPKPVKIRHRKTNPTNARVSLNKDRLENYGRLKDGHSNNGSDNSVNSLQDKKSRLSINDVHTDVDRASFTSSPLLHERRESTALDGLGSESRFRKALQWIKSKFVLPWYFVFVAWFLVFVFSVGSAVVLIMYGMRFGNGKSLQWLLSACISFVQDVLITQPLKVLGTAIFFALIIKKPDKGEFAITEGAAKLAEDEEYLHQELNSESRVKRPRQKTKLLPPDQAKLLAMRGQRMKERHMYTVIREVLFYYFFLCILMMLVYTQKDTKAFHQTQDFVQMIGKNFTKILKKKDFWAWTRKDFLPNLFPPNTKNDGFMSDGYSQMVGAARMRMIRMNNSSCLVNEQIYGMTKSCVGEYFIGDDDKQNYTVGWRNTTKYEELTYENMPWMYQTWKQLDGYPFWGMISTYSGGGYVIILEPGRSNTKRLWILEQNRWIDRNTRAVITEFTTYNAQSNLFTIVTLLAEFPATGGVVTFNSLQTVRLYDFTENSELFVRCIQAVFLCFIAYFFYKGLRDFYKQGCDFFNQFWNCIEAALVVFSVAGIGLYVYRAKRVNNVVERVNANPFNFKSFQYAAYWDDIFTFVMAAMVCLATMKFNRLLRFNKKMALLSSTLKHASFSLMMFSIVFFIVFLAYTSVAALVFGRNMFGYRTLLSSFVSLQNLMLGKMRFRPMQRANRVLGPVFFFSFMVVVSMVLVNMFLSIVIDSFHKVKHDTDKQSNEYEIVDFIIERFKLWTGIGHVRKPTKKRVLWDTAHSKVQAIQMFANSRISIGGGGMYLDNVSDLENRVEKLIERTDLLHEELFPEKRKSNGSGPKR